MWFRMVVSSSHVGLSLGLVYGPSLFFQPSWLSHHPYGWSHFDSWYGRLVIAGVFIKAGFIGGVFLAAGVLACLFLMVGVLT